MIVLAGTIGAGKSSLTQMIADYLHCPAYYEEVEDNKVLPLFYANPQQYAFLLQIYFLNKRFDSIKVASSKENAVLDRSIYEDSLLFGLNADLGRASKEEVRVYNSLLKNMMEELPYTPYEKNPELLIHIKVSFETMMERIIKRGRPFEQLEFDPSLREYYYELNQRYRAFYENYEESPKLEIDGDKYNFVEDASARAIVLQMVADKLAEIRQEAKEA
ncbi:deoxynucleoside kinase [Enterococcus nangangensis]|uniref:deoxynucleoside kinase n=1 Tax=Enterococcus nangangensis TaxID=2559926 RepID=UPI0010F4C685|nr:deoxynucleoside kinase [Enterococcus nangangensis]